jgi:hypothetical protein
MNSGLVVLLIAVCAVLVYSNPTSQEYKAHLHAEALASIPGTAAALRLDEKRAQGVSAIVSSIFENPDHSVLKDAFSRTDYGLFSVHEFRVGPSVRRDLGIAGTFVQLSRQVNPGVPMPAQPTLR